jgi:hypothetical protein
MPCVLCGFLCHAGQLAPCTRLAHAEGPQWAVSSAVLPGSCAYSPCVCRLLVSLQDSWRRAHTFSGQYEALLRHCGRFDGIGLAPGQQLAGVSLQPLVDEVRGDDVFCIVHLR